MFVATPFGCGSSTIIPIKSEIFFCWDFFPKLWDLWMRLCVYLNQSSQLSDNIKCFWKIKFHLDKEFSHKKKKKIRKIVVSKMGADANSGEYMNIDFPTLLFCFLSRCSSFSVHTLVQCIVERYLYIIKWVKIWPPNANGHCKCSLYVI